MRMPFFLGALLLTGAGACAQQAAPPARPAATPPAPKPVTENPNVVVLRSATRFWNDAALSKPVTFVVKDADAKAAVATLARAAALPMTVVLPPPPAVVTPPAPTANAAPGAPAPAAQPVPPTKATLELKEKPVRDAMRAIADAYRLTWHKEGANYVLRDDSFRPAAAGANQPVPNAQQPGYRTNGNNPYGNNNRYNNRRGPVERAPGVYQQRRGRRGGY